MGAVGAGLLVYGALVESNRLSITRQRLKVPRWPSSLDGFTIAFFADLHIRDEWSMDLAYRTVVAAIESESHAIAIAGDFNAHWCRAVDDYSLMLDAVLSPLKDWGGTVLAVCGNHDYILEDPSVLIEVCQKNGVVLLMNQSVAIDGVQWVGIESANAHRSMPNYAFSASDPSEPTIVLWHEPDMIEELPQAASLMLSGHSHGGQFIAPWGWAPMHTENGEKYVRGFYDLSPTPLYVTRGVGVTGYPSRLFCPPELAILELVGGDYPAS